MMPLELVSASSPTLERAQSLSEGIYQARQTTRAVLVSVSEPLDAFDPIALFLAARKFTTERYFWSQPARGRAHLGIGAAHVIETSGSQRFQETAAQWQALLEDAVIANPAALTDGGPRLLGGFAFDPQSPTTELWRGFPHGRMILPEILFSRTPTASWLTLNALVTASSNAAELSAQWGARAEQLRRAAEQTRPASNGHHAQLAARDLRPAAEWQRDVAHAVDAIQHGEMDKVVLARAAQLRATAPFDAARALQTLTKNYADCTLFAIARDDQCFLGATPERLVQLRAGQVKTMSLAGSIARGKSAAEDERLGQTLLRSDKDRAEHAFVVQAIVEALSELCAPLQVAPEPGLLKLGNIQHLSTLITGHLANGHTVLDLVERLHPTPAVGGRPLPVALEFIRAHERLDRGWYAGPVGWMNARGEGEFVVALRSALVRDDTATLFAGCGIVAHSDPKREYAEARLKLKPMLTALTGLAN